VLEFEKWMVQQGTSPTSAAKYVGAIRGTLSELARGANIIKPVDLELGFLQRYRNSRVSHISQPESLLSQFGRMWA
jgi:hypothetical protein